ncbi:MAG: SAM-dependent DNA methyltransferase [Ruminococcaceae bacterium]|nr:SAM-dependent DNA methyltransferase [Oscillospiraceae bacterium]
MPLCIEKNTDIYNTENALLVSEILKNNNLPTDLEVIVEFFECFLTLDAKIENGIIFTPKYISDYIIYLILESHPWDKTKSFIDPGCGSGIFLISVAEILHKHHGLSIDHVIENYIYGIDIDPDNVRCCILALRLLSATYDGDFNNINCNIHCCNSLKINWAREFHKDCFSYVVGNPPYVNPHDMTPDTVKFLKKTFQTTKAGVFNIFYAFIEHAMKNMSCDSILGYIIPNNFLTIKSAVELRNYIQTNKYLSCILDFGDNMVFKPIRTYNCIIMLDKSENDKFDYFVMKKCDNIETAIHQINFRSMNINLLDSNGWKLVDGLTRNNLDKIEKNNIPIKPFIRTGIATLKDAVFMVEHDELGFYKVIDSKKLYIEKELVKPIYKIPDLKLFDTIEAAERYIIFPYIKTPSGYVLIPEDEFSSNFPLTYHVLLSHKGELDTRDKGRPNPQGWYAYGRTQGLNKYGRKLLFPTFSNYPKFMYVNNEDTLFCNGYGIFENEYYELSLLSKILNSKVMNYYIHNTSYAIEGGYYCYQKKYIERFSIPCLTKDQIRNINDLSGEELDQYLWRLYELE